MVTDEVAYEENADIYEALEQAQTAADDAVYADPEPTQLTADNTTITATALTYTGASYGGSESFLPL